MVVAVSLTTGAAAFLEELVVATAAAVSLVLVTVASGAALGMVNPTRGFKRMFAVGCWPSDDILFCASSSQTASIVADYLEGEDVWAMLALTGPLRCGLFDAAAGRGESEQRAEKEEGKGNTKLARSSWVTGRESRDSRMMGNESRNQKRGRVEGRAMMMTSDDTVPVDGSDDCQL